MLAEAFVEKFMDGGVELVVAGVVIVIVVVVGYFDITVLFYVHPMFKFCTFK